MNTRTFLGVMGLAPFPNAGGHPAVTQASGGRYVMADVIPSNDAEFSIWLGNFNTVAGANLAALGLVAADLTPSTAAKTALDTAITDNAAKVAAATASYGTKKTARRTGETVVRSLARRITANPNVSNALKESLGLRPHDTPSTPITPVAPVELFVTGTPDGTNTLGWKSNGNKSGTIYQVEARIGAAIGFTYVATTTKTKFKHTGQQPGVRAVYRVRAQRGDVLSGPSNEAVIYDMTLELAA